MFFLLRCVAIFCVAMQTHGYLVEVYPSEYFKNSGRRIDHTSVILGAPSDPSHLPEAEPILPGHTLIRPTIGMLKSAIKFPHKEMENGAGVYGNIDSLGIRYNGKSDRVLYSGFRRSPDLMILKLDETKTRQKGSNLGKPYHLNHDSKEQENFMSHRPKEFRRRVVEDLIRRLNIIRNMEEKIESNEPPRKLTKETLKLDSIDETHNDANSTADDDTNLSDDLDDANANKTAAMWFWNNNDEFNHIKISQHAPEYNELVPEIDDNLEDIRSWWFYHQSDFTPLEDDVDISDTSLTSDTRT